MDLRALDPADAAQPELDLIALYSRSKTYDLQIRLDLLDLPETSQPDIYIALDLVPGGDVGLPINAESSRPWDILISIPSEGTALLSENQSSISNLQSPTFLIPRVVRDPIMDTVTISVNANLLPIQSSVFYIQVLTTAPNSPTVSDVIEMISSEAQPLGRAPLLISFWNSLPAHTPAQALRRWDGAHTGPLGRRHGLRHIVDAAQRYQVPITLLDLKSPFSLSALDLLNVMPGIAKAESDGILTLPDTLPVGYFGKLPEWAKHTVASISRQTGTNMGVSGSPLIFTYNQQAGKLSPYWTALELHDVTDQEVPQTHIYQHGISSILPLPLQRYDAAQITEEGLDLEIKKALLATALGVESSDPVPITLLGGNLPHTHWGDPELVDLAMRYIAAHPWIQAMGEIDILNYERISGYLPPEAIPTLDQYEPILSALEDAPPSSITALAWDAYLGLMAPADPSYEELPVLRSQYLGVIGDLLIAAVWDANVGAGNTHLAIRKDCDIDSDFDGEAECIISTEDVFALIDPQGARLNLLFIRDKEGIHQVVGQSSQFAVGLNDPFSWDLSRGPQADPEVIPGAFAGPWEAYEISMIKDGLRFTSPTVQKDFTLLKDGLRVEYQSNIPLQVQVPLALAPQTRFSSGWGDRYFQEETTQGWVWGVKSESRVQVKTSGVLTTQTFIDDHPALLVPENPNYEYLPGHYIPIPLAIATIQAEGNFWVELKIP